MSVVGIIIPVTDVSASGYNPDPSRCTASAPESWRWSGTHVYTKSQPWCLHRIAQASYLVWQSDGNFVWYVLGVPKASSGTFPGGPHGTGNTLVEQADGNIVVRNSSNQTIWGLNYWSNYWKPATPGAGVSTVISLFTQYVNSQTPYAVIQYYIFNNNQRTYSATINKG